MPEPTFSLCLLAVVCVREEDVLRICAICLLTGVSGCGRSEGNARGKDIHALAQIEPVGAGKHALDGSGKSFWELCTGRYEKRDGLWLQGGTVKLYSGLECPLDGFELLLFSLAGPDGKTYHICPYCYNHPPFEGARKVRLAYSRSS